MEKGKGQRFDQDKLRTDLVHPWAHEQMIRILTAGSKKYAPRNWELGMAWSKVIASLKRHLSAIEKGEDYDSETGELHAAHLACNAHFLTAYYKIYPQGDDRPHAYLNPSKIGLDIDGVIADFHKQFCTYTNIPEYAPVHWNDPTIRTKFDEVKKQKDFWATMPVLNSDLPFEPHCYITSRSIEPEVTQKWLDDNGFPVAPLYCVGHNMSKVEVAKQSGVEIFVDDKYENFIELNRNGICCFLFDASHNQKYDVGYRRLFKLKDLL
jgi:uncharacterized HAD superfamily protein